MSIAVPHLMAFAVLYLQANAIDKNQVVFPPDEYYCCQEAERAGNLWSLRFPRQPAFMENTMSIYKVVNGQEEFTYGIPIAKSKNATGSYVEVDVKSEHFTSFANAQGLNPDHWGYLPYDEKTDTITINPSQGDKREDYLTPKFCGRH